MAKPNYITDPKTFNTEYQRIVSLRKELKDRLDEVNALINQLEENSGLPRMATTFDVR